uniref:Uncharacterized protein n=1 Tax=Steinernema glaseri TaxID=37863 RepID=A0A1I7YWF8_9BILA
MQGPKEEIFSDAALLFGRLLRRRRRRSRSSRTPRYSPPRHSLNLNPECRGPLRCTGLFEGRSEASSPFPTLPGAADRQTNVIRAYDVEAQLCKGSVR